MLERIRQADDEFATYAQAITDGMVEERRVWTGEEEKTLTGFAPRAWQRSVVVGLPRVRFENGQRTYYIPHDVGQYHPHKAILNVQVSLSEGNSHEDVWVVASSAGKPFKPWKVRSRDSNFQAGLDNLIQGWFSPGMVWGWKDKISRGNPLGSWYVLIGRPRHHLRETADHLETVMIGGRHYQIDTMRGTHRSLDNPRNGLSSRETELEIYHCHCHVRWQPHWYVATTSAKQVFAGLSHEARQDDKFTHLRSAILAVEQKSCLCIHNGCYRPHFALPNSKIEYYGYPACDGMPSRAP